MLSIKNFVGFTFVRVFFILLSCNVLNKTFVKLDFTLYNCCALLLYSALSEANPVKTVHDSPSFLCIAPQNTTFCRVRPRKDQKSRPPPFFSKLQRVLNQHSILCDFHQNSLVFFRCLAISPQLQQLLFQPSEFL